LPSPTTARPLASTLNATAETPLFFECAGRPLYAVHYPARAARPGAPLLVVCHSLGVEQLTVYRSEVQAARAAAAVGVPAFHHHARGHGDSAGDFADVTFEGLVEDALGAAREGLERSPARGVVWLGVRFGALVAAAAARRAPGEVGSGETRGIALWEPAHRPHDYFRGQLRGLLYSQVAKGERPEADADQLLERVSREGSVDVHGYFLHRALVASSADQDLAGLLEGWQGPTLLAQIQARGRLAPDHAALVARLEARGVGVQTVRVGEEPGWHFISNPAWEAPALIEGTREWLRALA